MFLFASVWTNKFIFLLLRNPIRRNLKQSDIEEFFGSKQDREIAAANADLEKSATTAAAAALDNGSQTDSALSDSAVSDSTVSDTPRETADKKAGDKELGAGNSKLVTTLPPVKTKVCLHQIGTVL